MKKNANGMTIAIKFIVYFSLEEAFSLIFSSTDLSSSKLQHLVKFGGVSHAC